LGARRQQFGLVDFLPVGHSDQHNSLGKPVEHRPDVLLQVQNGKARPLSDKPSQTALFQTLRLDTKMDSYLKMIDTQRMVLYRKFDAALLRPFISHLYKPLKAIQITVSLALDNFCSKFCSLKRRRIVGQLRRGIYDDLEDLFMYGVYNIILYIVILVNKGNLTTVSKAEVESMLQGEHTRTLAFSKIRTLMQ
jgi:hypothetical protein